jgi:ketosteroid isomerase-like protein
MAPAISTAALANRFVEMCRQGKNFDVMRELYDKDIVSVEATRRSTGNFETAGQQAVIQKSADWAANYNVLGGTVDGPFLLGDRFAVVFAFEVAPKGTGDKTTAREVAVYTVANGLITREEFFYGEASAAALAR